MKNGQKKLIQDFNALGWVQIIFAVILIIIMTVLKDNSAYQVMCLMLAAVKLLVAFLMFRAKKHAKEGSKTAQTYGIITGILLIIALDIIDIILGILVLIDTDKYAKDVLQG